MAVHRENIRGRDILNLIEQVHRDRTLINMRLLDSDMELLTLIDDIQTSKRGWLFSVDLAPDLKQRLDSTNDPSLRFEFTDANKVPCEFITSPVEISTDRVWLLFPDVIHREQKREHFRIETPIGTRVCFQKNGEAHQLNVSDISMGGILATVRIKGRHRHILSVGDRLLDIDICFPSTRLRIREAVVIRQEERMSPLTLYYGIQFKAVDIDENRSLKEILYSLQREFLARRAGIA
jgi:c-di-GMP-binding flagellar brake protein YcgR